MSRLTDTWNRVQTANQRKTRKWAGGYRVSYPAGGFYSQELETVSQNQSEQSKFGRILHSIHGRTCRGLIKRAPDYVSGGQGEMALRVTKDGCSESESLKSNHEEADTRM